MSWLIWAVVLVTQQASHTLSSRSRNSASYAYHAAAAVFSNGVWWISLRIMVSDKMQLRGTMGILAFVFYVTFTVAGSVSAHYLCRKLERGNMKVGA
jgi:hypothetical protein